MGKKFFDTGMVDGARCSKCHGYGYIYHTCPNKFRVSLEKYELSKEDDRRKMKKVQEPKIEKEEEKNFQNILGKENQVSKENTKKRTEKKMKF